MIRLFLIFVFASIPSVAYALNGFSLNIESINTANWNLQGVKLALTGPAQTPQKLALTISKLSLPPPFDDLALVNIRCDAFSWQNQELLCQDGWAKLSSQRWQSPSTRFTLHVKEKHSTFKLSDLQLAGGILSVVGEQQGDNWQLRINAKAIDGRLVQKLLQTPPLESLFELANGNINCKLKATGTNTLIKEFTLSADGYGLTGQTKDGRFATEKLALKSRLQAQNLNGVWQWQNHTRLKAGALYIEPLYLEANGQNISLDTTGNWTVAKKNLAISSVHYQHATIVALQGSALIRYHKNLTVAKADLSLNSNDLEQFSAIYLKPLFEQTALEGLSAAGQLNAEFAIAGNALSALTTTVNKLAIHDTAQRISLKGGAGTIYWSENPAFDKPSHVTWQTVKLGPLPIGPSSMAFLTRSNTVRLLEKTTLPFLGGAIAINQLGWQIRNQQEPDIYFSGALNNVSLEQLALALNWTPLSGKISGTIPGVEYRDKTLNLHGEININAFDGTVKITNLASSNLFGVFPKLYGDLAIERLDLDQLTRKFKFGGMTGKLSGFVKQLYLENWHPVTFFAWLGTPDDDDSSHRISQKAVKNIASLGSGMASDILSRSFLSVFETFGYDKIGLGCYLHDGVCQMSGVEAAPLGYVIIKGGGLPRIDVIGYNPRVDWAVLMERLSRISTTDEVIVK